MRVLFLHGFNLSRDSLNQKWQSLVHIDRSILALKAELPCVFEIKSPYLPSLRLLQSVGRLSCSSEFLLPRLRPQPLAIPISATLAPYIQPSLSILPTLPPLHLSSHPPSSQSVIGTYVYVCGSLLQVCGYDYNFPFTILVQWLVQLWWVTASILQLHPSRRTYGLTTLVAE